MKLICFICKQNCFNTPTTEPSTPERKQKRKKPKQDQRKQEQQHKRQQQQQQQQQLTDLPGRSFAFISGASSSTCAALAWLTNTQTHRLLEKKEEECILNSITQWMNHDPHSCLTATRLWVRLPPGLPLPLCVCLTQFSISAPQK